MKHVGILSAAVCLFVSAALRADDPPATSEVVFGTISEVRPSKNGILFRRTSNLSLSQQEVTDYQLIASDALIILDGRRAKLADLRRGDRVRLEISKRSSQVAVVTALTPTAVAEMKKKAQEAKEFERQVEQRHLQMLRDEAAHQAELREKALAKLREKMKEKAKEKDKDQTKDKDKPQG